MVHDPSDNSSHDPADRAIAEYMLRRDRGEDVDRDAFVAQHPEAAQQLRAFFADSEAVRHLAGGAETVSLRQDASPDQPVETTIDARATRQRAEARLEAYRADRQLAKGLERQVTLRVEYRSVTRLARGGLGVVFKDLDENGRWVAIKAPFARHAESAEHQFPTESRIITRLSNAGSDAIITAHFRGHVRLEAENGARHVPFLDMEFFEGQTLQAGVEELFGHRDARNSEVAFPVEGASFPETVSISGTAPS